MTDPDFQTLLQSPLDDEPEPAGWGTALLGLVAGFATVIGVSILFGLWSGAEDDPAESQGAVTTTTVSIPPEPSRYPAGFAKVSESLGVKPTATLVGDGGFSVTFASATARDTEPGASTGLLGGVWRIERPDGSVVGMTRLVYDRIRGSVVAAEFPGAPSDGDTIRMTERWDPEERIAAIELPFSSTPYSAPEALELDLGEGVVLRIPRLELGRHLGRIAWTLSGPGDPAGVATFEVIVVADDGSDIGGYAAMPPMTDPTPAAGVTDLFWDSGFNVHPDEGSSVTVSATVRLVSPEPVDVTYPLDSVPRG